MSQHQDTGMNPYDTPPKKKKGWFGRNWLWFVPLVILLPLLCCCGGPLGLMWFGISTVQDMPPYKDSIAEVQQNQDIIAELGSPIPTPGLFEMMSAGGDMDVQTSGATMTFTAMIPMSGPNASGTLWVEAESTDGGVTWTYTEREFTFDHNNEAVDLNPDNNSLIDDAKDLFDSAAEAVEAAIEEAPAVED